MLRSGTVSLPWNKEELQISKEKTHKERSLCHCFHFQSQGQQRE